MLNKKAVFDVIWPRCQQFGELWWLFIFRFLLCKRKIYEQLFKVLSYISWLVLLFCICTEQMYINLNMS